MNRLKALRIERSWTQRNLADLLPDEVNRTHVSKWERTNNIPTDDALRLGEIFNVEPDTLTDEVAIVSKDDVVLKNDLLPAEIEIMRIITEHPDRHQFGKDSLLKILGVE